jgi:GGDEF domain-containing protein
VSEDEFVFLCENLSSPHDVEILATRIDKAFGESFLLTDRTELTVTASVGLAFAGPGEDFSDQLIVVETAHRRKSLSHARRAPCGSGLTPSHRSDWG